MISQFYKFRSEQDRQNWWACPIPSNFSLDTVRVWLQDGEIQVWPVLKSDGIHLEQEKLMLVNPKKKNRLWISLSTNNPNMEGPYLWMQGIQTWDMKCSLRELIVREWLKQFEPIIVGTMLEMM